MMNSESETRISVCSLRVCVRVYMTHWRNSLSHSITHDKWDIERVFYSVFGKYLNYKLNKTSQKKQYTTPKR